MLWPWQGPKDNQSVPKYRVRLYSLIPTNYKVTLDVFWICPPLFQTRVCPVDAERQVVPSKQQRARQTDPGWRKEEITKLRAKQHSKLPSTSHTSMNYRLRRIRFSAFATCIIKQPSDNADLLGKTGRFPKTLKLCLDVGENKFTQWRKPLRNILQYVLRSVWRRKVYEIDEQWPNRDL